MIVGFICSECSKYVQGSYCRKCQRIPTAKTPLNGNVINHIDSQWASENGGKGHYSHQYQRHFSSRKQLREHAKRCGDSIFDGPMGTNTGNYKNPLSDKERIDKIRKDRKETLRQILGKG